MEKTHRSAIVVVPPPEVWGPIQAIRREHDRHLRRWMPHVTLIYPFRPARTFDAALPHMVRACRKLPPFDVTLARFELFDHAGGGHTLWLAPEPRKAMTRLHNVLWEVVPDCDDVRLFSHGYTPHLSVGQAQGAAARQLRQALQAEWTPLRFTVREFHLISREPPDEVFVIRRTVPLKGRRRL